MERAVRGYGVTGANAEALFGKVLERQPKSALALYYRVLALCELGRVDEASALARSARGWLPRKQGTPQMWSWFRKTFKLTAED